MAQPTVAVSLRENHKAARLPEEEGMEKTQSDP